MKYRLRFTGEFKRSLKRCLKRGRDEKLLAEVLSILASQGQLPQKYRPHILHGNYEGYWNAILLLIGCLSGLKMMMNSFY